VRGGSSFVWHRVCTRAYVAPDPHSTPAFPHRRASNSSVRAIAAATVLTSTIFAADLASPSIYLFASLYALPLLICATIASMPFLWSLTLLCICLTFAAASLHAAVPEGAYINRSLLSFALLAVSLLVNHVIRARQSSAGTKPQLEAQESKAALATAQKSKFLSAVSHEIRTPANAVNLLAELLVRTVEEEGSSKHSTELPQIARDLQSSALSLVRLISDVLDVTRYDSGTVALDVTEFSLSDILNAQVQTHQAAAGRKGLPISVCSARAPATLRTDRLKLSRILSILLDNAIKFTATGHIHVTAEITPTGDLSLAVTDTGLGINAAHLEQIFDEFTQFRTAALTRLNGSGLNLPIARRLATALGGTLAVKSQPTTGSTFTLTLPAEVVSTSAHADGGSPASAAATKPFIPDHPITA
jgi:signal transduction histidine kinase